MLRKIEGFREDCINFVANNFCYHTKCMGKFMKTHSKCGSENSTVSGHNSMFQKLVSEISEGLLVDKHAYYISQLSKWYRELLQEVGEAGSQAYHSDRLKQRLLKYYGDDVQLIALKGRETLICASSLTVRELCAEVVALKSEVDECQLLPDEVDVGDLDPNISSSSYPLAKHLRAERKGLEKRTIREHGEDIEISYKGASNLVPLDLYNFLAWLLTDSDESLQEGGRV